MLFKHYGKMCWTRNPVSTLRSKLTEFDGFGELMICQGLSESNSCIGTLALRCQQLFGRDVLPLGLFDSPLQLLMLAGSLLHLLIALCVTLACQSNGR